MKGQLQDFKFLAIRLESWDNIIAIARQLSMIFQFRGQIDATWKLTTSLERLTSNIETWVEPPLRNREFLILTEFQRRAHHYISHPPNNNDFIEWLSLIQHHGGPTRLLDFTHSFYVATFFATEMAQNDSAVWAINIFKLYKIAEKYVGKKPDSETIYHINRRHVTFANHCISDDKAVKLVLNLEPDRINERMSVQQGTFLFPCDLTASFEENLIHTFGKSLITNFNSIEPIPYSTVDIADIASNDVIKIIIPRDIHARIVRELVSMNISAASLFPGLDGFARSLRYHLRSLEKNWFVR